MLDTAGPRALLQAITVFVVVFFADCKGGSKSSVSSIFEKTKFEEVAVQEQIQKILALPDSTIINNLGLDSLAPVKELKAFYKNLDSKVAFVNNKEALMDLYAAFDSVAQHGLSPQIFFADSLEKLSRKRLQFNNEEAAKFELLNSIGYVKLCQSMLHGAYPLDTLREEWYAQSDTLIKLDQRCAQLYKEDSIQYAVSVFAPKQKEYQRLCAELAKLKAIEYKNVWPQIKYEPAAAKTALEANSVKSVRKRLYFELGIPSDTTSTTVDSSLVSAIRRFQYMYDIKQTGQIDTMTFKRLCYTVRDKINIVRNNLERMRWGPNSYEPNYVYVNIPYMNLEYRQQDTVPFRMRIVVGRVSRPTPTLDAVMTNIVFNPPWNVPPTIMEQEIIPGVSKRGNSYLARRGLKAYFRGREVDASRINANNYKQFTISQKPGLNSSLGAVKFNLPNRHAIYLHDTPHREDFVKAYRAFSSGCVRVHKPREFAEFLLADSNYSRSKIDSIIQTKITREVKLPQKLPVHIVYLTNGIDSAGNLLYLRDIYAQDKKMSWIWQ